MANWAAKGYLASAISFAMCAVSSTFCVSIFRLHIIIRVEKAERKEEIPRTNALF